MRLSLYALTGFFFIAGSVFWLTNALSTNSFQSVEIGVAELSSKGEDGGYAVPASGGSPPAPPAAEIFVRSTTAGIGWTGSSITIDDTDDIDIQWESDRATVCNSGNGNFATGGSIDGTDTSPTQPSANETLTYRVNCSGAGGSDWDSVSVTAASTRVCDPDINTDSSTVGSGDTFNISWEANCSGGTDDTGNLSYCVVSGPGFNLSPLTSQNGNQSFTIANESIFIIDCRVDKSGTPGPSDPYETVRVRVLPNIQET